VAQDASVGPPLAASWWFIVLSWNGRDDTLACLRSLRAVVDDGAAVVCVDNGSQDGTVEAVRAQFPELEVVENGANLGFSGGNNAGIEHALSRGAEWVVLINNDATIRPGALDALRSAARGHRRAGVLSGKLFFANPSDRIWFAGQRFWPLLGYSGRPRGYRRRDAPRYRRLGPTDRAAGAFMAVSRAAIEAAGMLDDELFAYVEDVDWSLRVRDAGFEVLFCPEAVASHHVSASTGGERASTHALYYGVRNTVVVCERHRPLPAGATALRRALIWSVFMGQAVLLFEGRRECIRAVRNGYRDAVAGRLGERPASPG
jgi:GT2 family glycosyltransferase